jgi:Cu/Ag efflux pump CusA
VIYIEFDWNTDIRAARQTVQERLTTLGSILPEGILPQMTPPASIMGQIVVAGLYRQQGPTGGELFPIEGKRTYMAELSADSDADKDYRVNSNRRKFWSGSRRSSPVRDMEIRRR